MVSSNRLQATLEKPELTILREDSAHRIDVDVLFVRLSTEGRHGVGTGGRLTAYYAASASPASRIELLPGRFEALITSPEHGDNTIALECKTAGRRIEDTRVLFNGSDMSATIHELCLEVDRSSQILSAYIRYVKRNVLGVEFESIMLC